MFFASFRSRGTLASPPWFNALWLVPSGVLEAPHFVFHEKKYDSLINFAISVIVHRQDIWQIWSLTMKKEKVYPWLSQMYSTLSIWWKWISKLKFFFFFFASYPFCYGGKTFPKNHRSQSNSSLEKWETSFLMEARVLTTTLWFWTSRCNVYISSNVNSLIIWLALMRQLWQINC